MTARVTIIIAAYNSRWLPATLRSVQSQSFSDFTVSVLDDADSETCLRQVQELNDARFKYFPNKCQLGPAKNHEYGLSMVQSELVCIINHDDFWEITTLAQLIEALDAFPQAIAAFTRARVASEDGTFRRDLTEQAWVDWGTEELPDGLIHDWFTAPTRQIGIPMVPGTVFRSDALPSYRVPKAIGGGYDSWLGYRMARRRQPVVHVDGAIAYWREHPGNLTLERSARRIFESVYQSVVILCDRRVPWVRKKSFAVGFPRAMMALIYNAAVGPRKQDRGNLI